MPAPELRSHIGNRVRFKAPVSLQPLGAPDRTGKIVDEVWADESQRNPVFHDHKDPHCWGHYAFCSQLIEWDDGRRTIRLAYYRLACRGPYWRFAGQTTIETFPSILKSLMERTLSKAEWFTSDLSAENSK